MVIDPQKLLPSSRINPSSLAKVDTTTSDDANFSAKENKIIEVKEKLIRIDDILKGTLAVEKKKIDAQKKKDQDEKRKGREEKLELKPEEKKEKKKKNKLSTPSFLQSIIDFFKKIIFGYLAIKLLKHLPKLMPIVMGIMKFGEWFIDFSGKILNGLVTFIDAGYKAYDATRGFIKDKLGDGAVEKFDEFSGLLNKALNLALIVAMATSGRDLTRSDGKTGTSAGGQASSQRALRSPRSDARGNQIATRGREYRQQLSRVGTPNLKQTRPGSIASKFKSAAANLQTGTLLPKGAAAQRKLFGAFIKSKAGLKVISGFFKPILKRIPIIGGLIDFALNYFVFKQPLERSALKAIGATIFGALGAAVGSIVPFGGTFVGAVLGGLAGDMAGDLIYESFFNTEKQKSTPDIELKSEGGPVSSKKDDKLKADKIKQINVIKQTLKVSEVKLSDDKSSFTETVKAFNDIDFFGPILATSLKLISDDKIDSSDYDSIGAGIGNLFIQGVQENKLPQDNLINPQKFSKWAGKTFKKSVEDKITIIKQGLDKTKSKSEEKKESSNLNPTDVLARFIAGMSPGSTDGPGSVATERDSATGVPLTSAGQAPGAVQADSDIVSSMGFSTEDWNLFRNTVAQIESGGRYDIAGGSGGHYDGRYQLGAAAKIDGSRYAGIADPGHNPAAREAFRKNPELQEKIFTGFTKANHTYLMGVPEYRDANQQRKLQILGYAHNQGMGGAANWMKTGIVGADGFGTKGTKYTDSIAAEFRKRSSSSSDLDFATMQTGGVVSRNMSRVETKTNSLMDYPSYGEETETNIIVINKKTVGSQNNHSSPKIRRRNITIKGSQSFSEVFDIYG